MEKSDYDNDLARNGLKTTKRRTEILSILKENDQPLAADQVFLALKKKVLRLVFQRYTDAWMPYAKEILL